MHTLLLSLLLLTDPSAPTKPEVSPQEQITLLKLQVDELAAKNAALERTLARIEGVNKLASEWNKRGCLIESDQQTGLVRCKVPEPTKK